MNNLDIFSMLGFNPMIPLVISIVFMIIIVIINWKILTKIGEKGWSQFIPIYNVFCEFRGFKALDLFKRGLIWLAIWIIGGLLAISDNTIVLYISIGIQSISSIALWIISIKYTHRKSVRFGKGVGFTLLQIFLAPIAILIMAFGLKVPEEKVEKQEDNFDYSSLNKNVSVKPVDTSGQYEKNKDEFYDPDKKEDYEKYEDVTTEEERSLKESQEESNEAYDTYKAQEETEPENEAEQSYNTEEPNESGKEDNLEDYM